MPDVFPFYDAEPWWYKRDYTSDDSGGGGGGGGGGGDLPLVGSAIVGTAVLVDVNEGGPQ